jgi:Cytidylate kinase-like family
MASGDRPPEQPAATPLHGFRGDAARPPVRPAVPAALTVAVSREAGARGGTIGRRVGRKLGWQVYDQELLEHVAQLSTFQQSLTSDLTPAAAAWVDERLRGLLDRGQLDPNPTIVNLARLGLCLGAHGQVVLIGRGTGFLLPGPTTVHARLVAPLHDRVAYMAQHLRLTPEEARQRVRLRDERRNEFLTTYLHRNPADACCYDLVLNTSGLGEELCAELIVQAVRAKAALAFGLPEADPGVSLP